MDNFVLISVLIGAVIVVFALYFMFGKKKKIFSQKLVLHQFPTFYDTSSASPFCTKLETWLKMNGVTYETDISFAFGPKGKLPYIEIDGKAIGDSSIIIEYISNKYNITDKHYNDAQLISAFPLKIMMEEFFYWVVVEQRWQREEIWDKYVIDKYFYIMPKFIRRFVVNNLIRTKVLKNLKGQGLGLHTTEEIERFGITCLKATVNFLGDKNFMLGDFPSSVDATVYAFLACITDVPYDSVYKAFIMNQPNLVLYLKRMKTQFWK